MSQPGRKSSGAGRRRLHPMRLAKTVASVAATCAAPLVFSWSGLLVCLLMVYGVGTSISVGYHRLLAHRAWKAPRLVAYFWAVLGCCCGQGGPLTWVAIHRLHHARADRDGDPHSPTEGLMWSQLFWNLFYRPDYDDPALRRRYVPDLAADPVFCALERWEAAFPVGVCAALFLLGQAFGQGWSWAVWGGAVNMTVLYNLTSLVNSACHRWGARPHATRDRSANVFWLPVLYVSGECWHNNHHALPRSARHGRRWWQVDLGYLLIRAHGVLGLAREVLVPGGKPYLVLCPRRPAGKEGAACAASRG